MSLPVITNFSKFETQITNHIETRKSSYFNSPTYKKLASRVGVISDSVNLRFAGARTKRGQVNNIFKSKLAFPLLKERTNIRRAALKAVFRSEPLITYEAMGDTPYSSAMKLTQVEQQNLTTQKFRARAWNQTINTVSKFGSAILYSSFEHTLKFGNKTINDPILGIRRQSNVVIENHQNVVATPISILNYFQNEHVPNHYDSPYKGHMDKIHLSRLIALGKQNKGLKVYIQANLDKVIKRAKTERMKDINFKPMHDLDFDNTWMDITKGYTTLPINGNEEDETTYYYEMIGGIIIRLQDNPNDLNIDGYSVFTIEERPDFWWGNSDAEQVKPHENYLNLIMNLNADQALNNIQRFIFYDKNAISPSDINNRHKGGGWIPMDAKGKALSQYLQEYQPRDASLPSTDFITRQVKESAQAMSSKPDFLRSGNKGGLANNTATAANILEGQGQLLETDIAENVSYGIMEMADAHAILLQQHLPDKFLIRNKPSLPPEIIDKTQILGEFNNKIKTALQENMLIAVNRLNGFITQAINYKGTGLPEFQRLNLLPAIQEWVKNIGLPREDEIITDEALQEASQITQSQLPGAPPPEEAAAVEQFSQAV